MQWILKKGLKVFFSYNDPIETKHLGQMDCGDLWLKNLDMNPRAGAFQTWWL